MTGRRLPVLVVLVVGFVAVVALVAHGRPLAASAGRGGVSTSFWSYVLTTAVILFALGALLVLAMLLDARMTFTKPNNASFTVFFFRSLIGLIVIGGLMTYVLRHFLHHGEFHINISGGGGGGTGTPKPGAGSSPHFLWLEVLIIVGLLAVATAAAVATKRRNRGSPPAAAIAPEAVAEALDESLDDLRTDPDLRRAIEAAYARMENALRVTGLARQPAEAPHEYLERALLTLDTSGPAVRRLTDLFEWAKFSHHEPEPTMRDEAVEALIAVRDELRAPVPAAAEEVPA